MDLGLRSTEGRHRPWRDGVTRLHGSSSLVALGLGPVTISLNFTPTTSHAYAVSMPAKQEAREVERSVGFAVSPGAHMLCGTTTYAVSMPAK